MTLLAPLVLLVLCGAEPEAASSEESARRDAVAKLAPAKARRVNMLVGDDQAKAELREEPLLRWSNPTAGSVYGEVFVWSHLGRPAAIASIYRWYDPYKDSTFEVVSTSTNSVVAKEDENTLWEARVAGVVFAPLPGAQKPADSASGRLAQMRRLARRFSASLIDQRAGAAVSRELRLLNQPVHRYESAEQKVIDGALFALVEVTDPEAWIILEAVKRDDGEAWQYALARMNRDGCRVRLDDKVVQQWDHIVDPWKNRQAPYTLLSFKPEEVESQGAEGK